MNCDEIKKEIEQLIKLGKKLYGALIHDDSGKSKDISYFASNYEMWYSKIIVIVKQFAPDRLSDLVSLYKNEKRKELNVCTYTISDALQGIYNEQKHFNPETASSNVVRQIQIVQACLDSFDSKVYNIQTILQADIFDSELDAARHLLKMGFTRAAGAICGVVLEKHFAGVANSHNIVLKKKDPTISDYNDAFKDNVYDVIEWRKMQHLGDIRNYCDHKKDREPTKDEVEELISGTDRVIKNIF